MPKVIVNVATSAATSRRLPNSSSGSIGRAARRWLHTNAAMPATATTASATVHAGAIVAPSTRTMVSAPRPSIASAWPATSKLAASGSRDSGR